MPKQRKGYVYQDKEGKWCARTTITDEQGNRRNIVRRAESKKDADATLRKILCELEDKGSSILDSARITFNELAERYEQEYAKPPVYYDGQKVAGLRDWQRVRRFLQLFRKFFGRRKLVEIRYNDLKAYRLERLQTTTQYERQRSITAVNRELAYLRRVFNIGVREGLLQRNPFNFGEPLICLAAERRRERILTREEEIRLLNACEKPKRKHLRPLIICLLDSGARKSEMLKLRWHSVCFVTRTITIEGLTTKTLQTRQVVMTERVFRELSALWEISSRELYALVFGITNNVRRSFASACKEAGIKHGGIDGLTIHCLRHSAASRLVNGQMSLQMVGRILGHTQPQTTYRYLSANTETMAKAASILEAFQIGNEA